MKQILLQEKINYFLNQFNQNKFKIFRFNINNKLIQPQMKQSKCYTCEKITHNLLTANCGHKICFNCVKNNRNNHKCIYCTAMSTSKNKIIASLSPAKRYKLQMEKDRQTTANTKSIQTKKHQDSSLLIQKSSRPSRLHIQSCSNYVEGSTFQEHNRQIKLLCKEHHEPLTLFSKVSKEAICSMCLCSKPKYNQEIIPIKGAEIFFKKENQIQREQSRKILSEIQKCSKTMKQNYEKFEVYYGSHIKIIQQIFLQLKKELQQKQIQLRKKIDSLFIKKLRECEQIQQDLCYLIQTLQTYRDENKENNTLTESLYVYSSFKVIKQTMKTLNLDYVSYSNKNINLLEYNKAPFSTAVANLLKINEQLPLKHFQAISQSRKNRSSSSRQHVKQNSYSKKKRLYQNALNEKMGIKHEHHQISNVNKTVPLNTQYNKQMTSPYSKKAIQLSQQHNNSLQSYINRSIKQQNSRHNINMLYFNKSQSRINQQQKVSSYSAFDYQLKTPIKNLLSQQEHSKSASNNKAKNLSESHCQKLSETDNKSYGKIKKNQDELDALSKNLKNKDEFNALPNNSLSEALKMNEEEKSLYKRLLKSRFSKNIQQQEHQPNQRLQDSEK